MLAGILILFLIAGDDSQRFRMRPDPFYRGEYRIESDDGRTRYRVRPDPFYDGQLRIDRELSGGDEGDSYDGSDE
jgi:hypothetical protein